MFILLFKSIGSDYNVIKIRLLLQFHLLNYNFSRYHTLIRQHKFNIGIFISALGSWKTQRKYSLS